MTAYYVRLALKSFARNPGLTALMVLAIGLGIAICVITLTMYRAMAGNPLWYKDDRLYAVTIDAWDPEEPYYDVFDEPELAHLPPPQLTYRDVNAIYESDIPVRKAKSYTPYGILTTVDGSAKPQQGHLRVTTRDFFAMFDAPFLHGTPWNAAADEGPEPVIVLSKGSNDELFGGENSVGRSVRFNDREFRVVGVVDEWLMLPRVYDLETGALNEPSDAYLPFLWGEQLELFNAGNTNCWKPEPIDSFKQFLGSECIWTQLWVELPDENARERMHAWLDNYAREQKNAGRYARPINNRLTRPSQWLIDNQVVSSDNRLLVGIAFAFLAVCLINTVGLLLAKFLNGAAITGVRRALGASRRQVFLQLLTEVGVVAASGALVGFVLGALGLWGLRALYADPVREGGYEALAHVDTTSVIAAFVLAVVAAVAAGLYPAWRIGRLPPASYLKSQ
jgi:putative ABC transport system permease protein